MLDSYADNITVSYGPILPDKPTKDDFNLGFKNNTFETACRGLVLPQKKDIIKITLTPLTITLKGENEFYLMLEAKKIQRIENSSSDGKAVKLMADVASKSRFKFKT